MNSSSHGRRTAEVFLSGSNRETLLRSLHSNTLLVPWKTGCIGGEMHVIVLVQKEANAQKLHRRLWQPPHT